MQILFCLLYLLVILTVTFLTYSLELKKVYKGKKANLINSISKVISIIFIATLAIFTLTLGLEYFLFFIGICLGIATLVLGILHLICKKDKFNICYIVLSLILFLIGSFFLFTTEYKTTNEIISKKDVILTDCLETSLKSNNKALLIELDYHDKDLYLVQQYNSNIDVELPHHIHVNDYYFTVNEENRLIVTTTQTTHFNLLSYFELIDTKKTQDVTYTLYLNFKDTLHCS